MEIDIEKATKEFIKYTEQFDLKNDGIKRKQGHSLRVMQMSKKIAEKLKLDKQDIELATLIGLLHDIGRFEQYTNKKDADHGDLGVEILNNTIRNYIDTDQYDEIIKKAIKNHNKYKIEENLTEKEKLHAKIIRDADKIDILYESVEIYWKNQEEKVNESKISQEIIDEFNKEISIKRIENETPIDDIITVISFLYDINYNPSFEIIEKENYINDIFKRYNFKDENTKNQIEQIKSKANNYIRGKIWTL